jgi:hypothetical protein
LGSTRKKLTRSRSKRSPIRSSALRNVVSIASAVLATNCSERSASSRSNPSSSVAPVGCALARRSFMVKPKTKRRAMRRAGAGAGYRHFIRTIHPLMPH